MRTEERQSQDRPIGRIPPGTTVSWTSQSWGVEKTKTGQVLAFVPAGHHPRRYFDVDVRGIPASRLKFDFRPSRNDRYIVAVPRGGQSKIVDYYAPMASRLEPEPEITRTPGER